MPRYLKCTERHVVGAQPSDRSQQLARSTTTTSARHTQGAVVHQNRQVQELRRHSDVFRGLGIALDCVHTGHMCPGGPLAQEHEHWPNTWNAGCQVDVRIEVVRDPWPSSQIHERIVQTLQSVPQFRAETVEV